MVTRSFKLPLRICIHIVAQLRLHNALLLPFEEVSNTGFSPNQPYPRGAYAFGDDDESIDIKLVPVPINRVDLLITFLDVAEVVA